MLGPEKVPRRDARFDRDVAGTGRSRVASAALFLLVASACVGERGGRRPTALHHTIDTTGSVVHIANSGTPPTWQLEPIVTVGSDATTDPPAPDEFGRITSVTPGPGGNLWVADEIAHQIKEFSPDGSLLHAIGREGEGPGEFEAIYSIAWVGHTLLALDFGVGRVVELSDTGAWLGMRPAPGSISGSTETMRFYGVTDTLVDEWSVEVTGKKATTAWIEQGPHAVEGVWPQQWLPPPATTEITCRSRRMISFFDLPFAGQMLYRPAGGGRTWVAWSRRYRIALIDAHGDTLRVVERDRPRVAVTDTEWDSARASYRSFLKRDPGADCRSTGIHRPDTRPALSNLLADPSGRLWVEAATDSGTVWEVFDRDGVLLGALPGFRYVRSAPPTIRGDLIAWVSADTLGVERAHLARIR